ncbi:MAG: MogA/MoaB family molybdenum cofactor biosynthesis protein [Veillonella sp.]|uniref:MogA/MoaB family molybdenum cofactor biosynthesis protein n=1 Tax=Veillonella sp. TaxID=1926307 RepID=UPI0025E374EA|nr:MogA/MoaB family molybdenum cofactor biosynthesis protein [Veillonella sp.]MBS4914155.1 MogA/MoaB family molybdenum cofactor biosynthesis protein [Veillonella sp.]
MSLQEVQNRPLVLGVITVSDTRTPATDKGGDTVVELLEAANHIVKVRTLLPDDANSIMEVLDRWISIESLDGIILTGGTGIAYRDVTIEAVSAMIEKEIPGFGEFFRYLSLTEDIGTRAMASRALAGVARKVLIFALPGSVGAVTLGMNRLILPEINHLVYEVTK